MSEDKSPNKKIDLKKYEDPTNLSPKNLEFGLWIANNRKKIYKFIIIILTAIAAGFVLYSGYNYFYYFTLGQEQDRSLSQDTSGLDLTNYRLQNKPQDMLYDHPVVISNNGGSDFFVHLKNPNEKQYATFSFCFTTTNNEACGTGFILPGEEKNLLLVNSNIKSASGSAGFEIKNISWQKIKAGEIPDLSAFNKQRLNFAITEPKFSTYDDELDYLEFSITNNSTYGYFEVPLNIVISRGSEIMAINRFVIKDLSSQETKDVRLFWPEGANLGGTITVTPELNLMDSSIYKPYTSN